MVVFSTETLGSEVTLLVKFQELQHLSAHVVELLRPRILVTQKVCKEDVYCSFECFFAVHILQLKLLNLGKGRDSHHSGLDVISMVFHLNKMLKFCQLTKVLFQFDMQYFIFVNIELAN